MPFPLRFVTLCTLRCFSEEVAHLLRHKARGAVRGAGDGGGRAAEAELGAGRVPVRRGGGLLPLSAYRLAPPPARPAAGADAGARLALRLRRAEGGQSAALMTLKWKGTLGFCSGLGDSCGAYTISKRAETLYIYISVT